MDHTDRWRTRARELDAACARMELGARELPSNGLAGPGDATVRRARAVVELCRFLVEDQDGEPELTPEALDWLLEWAARYLDETERRVRNAGVAGASTERVR